MSEPRTAADAAAWIASEFYADEGMAKLLALAELGAAWAEAEAALPEGAFLVLSDDPRYTAEATRVAKSGPGVLFHEEAEADTPAAALRALAARLRTPEGEA